MAHGISVPSGGRAVPRGPKRLLVLRGDDHLVERVRRGDETAFEVIYERHVPGVLSFCRHMLGTREEAEDAVQHVFIAAHRALLRDERQISLKAWLYAIARNRCLSMLRARREQSDEDAEPSTEGLDAEVQQRADLRQLVADLHDLPEDQRAALVLSELRDLSHAEVADVLGCRVANVKGLVFRARAGLSERAEARDTPCEAIRQELATTKGGALRRGKLRHHLRACAPCSAYLEDVRRQRRMMAAILPVVPTAGLKSSVLAAVGAGGAVGGGGAAAGGGVLAALTSGGGATVAKVAVIGAVATGGGIVGEAALKGDNSAPDPPSAFAPGAPPMAPGGSSLGSSGSTTEQNGKDASAPAATGGRRPKPKPKPKPKHDPKLKQKLKRQKLTHGRRPVGGPSAGSPTAGRGGQAGGKPSRRRVRGKAPKPPRVPRRTRARPRPAAPGKRRARMTPPGEVGKVPSVKKSPTDPDG